MNTEEAMRALLDGKKIRKSSWSKGQYFVKYCGHIINQDKREATLNSTMIDLSTCTCE